MADTRIGSVSSWVNILTLLARNADTVRSGSLVAENCWNRQIIWQASGFFV